MLPSELGSLEELETFVSHSNQFTGTVPSELGHFDKLKMLWLQDNKTMILRMLNR
jgi:hypothetical protein